MCSVYYEGRNARYFSPLIAKATTTEGHHQGLFGEKEKERVNKSSGIFGHGENLEKKLGWKAGK